MGDKNDPRKGWTSASDALADSLCPARHLAQRGIPRPEPSSDASIGTKIHFALSVEDKTEARDLPVALRDIFDKCRLIEAKKLEEFFGSSTALTPGFHRIRERSDGSTRLWAQIPGNQPGKVYYHSAQPDLVAYMDTRALVVEYKTLAGDVPSSSENLQLRDQAVLFKGANPNITEIGTVVVQPMVEMDPKICVYTEDNLKRAQREMFDRVRASNNPESKPIPGSVQCEYCLAKKSCVAYHQWAGSMVPAMLTVLEVPVSAWTSEQMVAFLRNRKVAQKWLDTCMEEIEKIVQVNPAAVPGYALRAGATREIITNPQLVFERFVGIGGSTEDFMKCISVKKSALKEAVYKTTRAKGGVLTSVINTLVKDAIETKQNKPTLIEIANEQAQAVEDQ